MTAPKNEETNELYREWSSHIEQDFIRLGTAIKYARDAVSLSLAEFSRATGLSEDVLAEIESGNISQFSSFVFHTGKTVEPVELLPKIAEIEMALDWPEGRFMAIVRNEFHSVEAVGPQNGHPDADGPWEMLTPPVTETDAAGDQEALRKEKIFSLVSGYQRASDFLDQLRIAHDSAATSGRLAQDNLDSALCAVLRSHPLD